ncbi:MAG: AtpZ/AtpI family protein [Lachnospiraceae bacterium]|nr:AtpZ/AtpI family protein [Lachnospiraceae bacterium]
MSDRLNDPKNKRNKSSGRNDVYRNLTLITQFTLFMLVPIGGLSAAGYFLDKHFGTSWIVIAGFFLGAVAGGNSVYRLAMKIANEKRKEPERNIINRRKDPAETNTDKISADKISDDASFADNASGYKVSADKVTEDKTIVDKTDETDDRIS